MTSPTSLAPTALRRQGFVAHVVERWIAQVGRKRNLFGIADVFGFHPRDRVLLLVQATSIDHVAGRLARCRQRAELAQGLRAGGVFEVWGWARRVQARNWAGRSSRRPNRARSPIILPSPRTMSPRAMFRCGCRRSPIAPARCR